MRTNAEQKAMSYFDAEEIRLTVLTLTDLVNHYQINTACARLKAFTHRCLLNRLNEAADDLLLEKAHQRHTADHVAELEKGNRVSRDAEFRLIQAAEDALKSLSILADAPKANRAVSIQQLQSACKQFKKTHGHKFDATGAAQSNEPNICATCGLDVKSTVHV
jgi:hypothetical protein